MNNILVPLNSRENIDHFIKAGADEFYMGFFDESWTNICGEYSEINRMSGFKSVANRYQFAELLDIVKCVKDKQRDIFVTINSAAYSPREMDLLSGYFEKLADAGADGVIISTPELVRKALEYKLKPVASTMCGIYNSDIASLYKKIGVDRMIIPRDLSSMEIQKMTEKNPDVQYEVFLMRNGCQFSDSHCLGFHRREHGSMCGALNGGRIHIFSQNNGGFKSRHDIELNDLLYRGAWHKQAACGLCALYRFVHMNIAAYKIVGRADDEKKVLRDIELVRENILLAKEATSEEEFLEKMRLIDNSYSGCKCGFGCYYPEIRF